MNHAVRTALLLVAATLVACVDRPDDAAQEHAPVPAGSSVETAARTPGAAATATMTAYPANDREGDDEFTFDDATPILTVLTEWSIRLSSDTVRNGDYAFVLHNRTIRPHVLEVRGDNGMRWRSLPLPPGSRSRLALPLGPGTYSVTSVDTTYARRGMRTALVVMGR